MHPVDAPRRLPATTPDAPRLEVDELVMTRWCGADLDELAEMHLEPETMAPFGGPMTRADSDTYASRVDGWFDEFGFGLFCVRDVSGTFLGSVGLAPVPATIDVPFPAEVGWRLRRAAWGRGVATRAARRALTWARDTGGPTQVCSFTAASNERSEAVMVRLGLHRRADLDFEHPAVAQGDPRRAHIVYASVPAPTERP